MHTSTFIFSFSKSSVMTTVLTLVLMGSAGAAAAAPPVPAELAGWVTANTNGGYNITPTGIDDSEHIQWAVDNADPHGQILLATGSNKASDFYLSHGIYASNFVGSIRGVGRDITVLHTLNGYGYDGEMPFQFYYDRRLGYTWVDQGHVDIGHFKLVVDGPTAVWNNHGYPSIEVPGVVGIVDMYLQDLYEGGSPQPWPDTGVDVRVHDIWAVGEHRAGQYYPWGTTLLWPVDIEFVKGGDISIQNFRMDETHFTYLRPLYDCDVEISGIELNVPRGLGVTFYAEGGSLTVHDSVFRSVRPRFPAMYLEGPYSGSLTVYEVVTKNASGVAYFGNSSSLPVTVSIRDNKFDQPDGAEWGAIEIWDDNAGDAISISENTITSSALTWPAIFVADANEVRIRHNSVSAVGGRKSITNDISCSTSIFCPAGIAVLRASAIVDNNQVSYMPVGILAVRGSADVKFNDVWWAKTGVAAVYESEIVLEGNKLTHNEVNTYADASSSITQIDD